MDELSQYEAAMLKEVIQLIEDNDQFEDQHIVQPFGSNVTLYADCAQQIIELNNMTDSVSKADEKMSSKYDLDVSGPESDNLF